jgi:hypothetical protein
MADPTYVEIVVDGTPELIEVDVGTPGPPGSGGGGGGTPATTVVGSTSFGQGSAVGVGTKYAREDHVHGTPSLGTSGTTACAGNDGRLSDARTPLSHTHPESDVTGLVADLASLASGIAGSVPTSRTVNGHALSANVTITAADIGLGSVVNADTTTTANISDSSNKRFVTDAYLVVLSHTSGTNTGDQDLSGLVPNTRTVNGQALSSNVIVTTISGNAGTATALATARTINGTSFDGTTNITVTAAAGTLTGSSLNATVTGSSLTSLGTIVTGVWNGTAIAVANGGTGATSASAARTNLGVVIGTDVQAFNANTMKRVFGVVIDGGGAVPSTGVQGYFRLPWNGTITKVTLLADQTGSAVVDVWKDTYANYPPTVADTITASAKPTLSSASKYEDSTLTGWTTSVTAGDVFGFNLNSVTTCQRLILEIEVTLT